MSYHWRTGIYRNTTPSSVPYIRNKSENRARVIKVHGQQERCETHLPDQIHRSDPKTRVLLAQRQSDAYSIRSSRYEFKTLQTP